MHIERMYAFDPGVLVTFVPRQQSYLDFQATFQLGMLSRGDPEVYRPCCDPVRV